MSAKQAVKSSGNVLILDGIMSFIINVMNTKEIFAIKLSTNTLQIVYNMSELKI